MRYLSDRKQKRHTSLRYIFSVIFLLVTIIFWVSFKTALYPFFEQSLIRYGSVKEILSTVPEFISTYMDSREKILQRDKDLEITVERLENELAEKNARLKELDGIVLNFGDTAALSSTIVMYPLMKDITSIYSTILFSKGFKDGVEKDVYVYVRGMQPVCIIKEVYTLTSLCQLLSASGVTTEAVIRTSSSTEIGITLSGRGGGTFLGDVLRDTVLVTGDPVYLKSDPSMLLGTVVEVLHNNQDTSWHVFVRGMYNPITSSIFYIRKK